MATGPEAQFERLQEVLGLLRQRESRPGADGWANDDVPGLLMELASIVEGLPLRGEGSPLSERWLSDVLFAHEVALALLAGISHGDAGRIAAAIARPRRTRSAADSWQFTSVLQLAAQRWNLLAPKDQRVLLKAARTGAQAWTLGFLNGYMQGEPDQLPGNIRDAALVLATLLARRAAEDWQVVRDDPRQILSILNPLAEASTFGARVVVGAAVTKIMRAIGGGPNRPADRVGQR